LVRNALPEACRPAPTDSDVRRYGAVFRPWNQLEQSFCVLILASESRVVNGRAAKQNGGRAEARWLMSLGQRARVS